MTLSNPTENLLELRNIVKAYGRGERQFTAVRDVNLRIRPGEFVCLLGPSGCGKSTLLRMIAGLNSPTSGTILYRGIPLKGINPHATIVFQTFALYTWLSVQENVEIALKARGVPPDERARRALKLIDTVGLDGFESAYPRELSGGMRQKVGFARAMAVEPELLCLDEPFSALDVLSADALRGELIELWQNKTLPTKAVLMADRIVVMAKDPGRIIAEIEVALRHPRGRKDVAFQAQVDKVYAAVTGKTKAEPQAGEGERRKKLPDARLNALAGLVEKLMEDGGRTDLYRLAGQLTLELDDLLPIVEAGELLGLLNILEGDLMITPLGRAYAEASILARKELTAGRILRLPIINWIYDTLLRDDDRRVPWDYFFDSLKSDFGDRAEEQLEIAIGWGRHAELFAYDDDTGELYLEN